MVIWKMAFLAFCISLRAERGHKFAARGICLTGIIHFARLFINMLPNELFIHWATYLLYPKHGIIQKARTLYIASIENFSVAEEFS
jgi:hypothetical protein